MDLSSVKEYIESIYVITKQTDSSGSSVIFYTDENIVIQYFTNKGVFNRICNMMVEFLNKPNVKLSLKIVHGFGKNRKVIYDPKHTYEYNIFTTIPEFLAYIPEMNTVLWNKIIPLNSMNSDHIRVLVNGNKYKFLWDIGKSLFALHTRNILHNDCRLDNIGIQNGHFVLFDFDGSGSPSSKGKQLGQDFLDLKNSLEYHNLDDVSNLIPENTQNLAKNIFINFGDQVGNYDKAVDILDSTITKL